MADMPVQTDAPTTNTTMATIEKLANGYVVSHCTESNLQKVEGALMNNKIVKTFFDDIDKVLAHLTAIGL